MTADGLLQNEKCHLLVENETLKLKHLDEQNNQLLKEWRDQLRPRKKVCVWICFNVLISIFAKDCILMFELVLVGPRG